MRKESEEIIGIDKDYFIKDCFNCEHVEIVSIDGITIDKMYCGLTNIEIIKSKLICSDFKISESAKIVHRITDEESKRIEESK